MRRTSILPIGVHFQVPWNLCVGWSLGHSTFLGAQDKSFVIENESYTSKDGILFSIQNHLKNKWWKKIIHSHYIGEGLVFQPFPHFSMLKNSSMNQPFHHFLFLNVQVHLLIIFCFSTDQGPHFLFNR